MEYDVPEKIAIYMDKMFASEDLRDRCIKLPFGFRRARKSARDVCYFKRKFWTGVFEIYPEIKDKRLFYSLTQQKVKTETDNKQTHLAQTTGN